jgi:hypothetical protein
MMDMEERARRAGEAARAEALARASRLVAPEPRTARPWTTVLVAAGIGLAALLVVFAVASSTVPPRLEIDPVAPVPADPAEGLPVPDVGDAVAAQLADGAPVFVTQPVPGEVLVLDAVDPHDPRGLRKVVVFCRSSAVFEDPRYGSRFDQWGNWLGGPAPTGLARYPSESAADGSTVRVVGDRGPAPARDAHRDGPGQVEGASCQLDEGSEVSEWVSHRPPEQVPSLDGDAIPRDRWVWASLLLAGPVDRLVVCETDGTCGAGPIITTNIGAAQPDREVPPTSFLVLARSIGVGQVEGVFSPSTLLLRPDAAWHPFDLVRFEDDEGEEVADEDT